MHVEKEDEIIFSTLDGKWLMLACTQPMKPDVVFSRLNGQSGVCSSDKAWLPFPQLTQQPTSPSSQFSVDWPLPANESLLCCNPASLSLADSKAKHSLWRKLIPCSLAYSFWIILLVSAILTL